MADRSVLLEWLNEAYIMENGIAGVLEGQLPQTADLPDLQDKLREHSATTRRQAERLRDHIHQLGGTPAVFIAGAAGAVGAMQGALSGGLPTPLVRDSVLNYATAHFEIATYTALIAAAKALEEAGTIHLCEELLKEEEEMGRWLHRRLPRLVADSLGTRTASPR